MVLVFASCGTAKRDLIASDGGGAAGVTGSSAGTSGSSGMPSAAGKAGNSAPTADAGAAGEAGSGSLDEQPLSVVSVTPDGQTATTRDVVSVTFSRPPTEASVELALSIEDGRGKVSGSWSLDGNVARFEPHGSLCFDQSYTVSIAASAQTADATKLNEAKSFSFRIPDGAWQDAVALASDPSEISAPEVDLDVDGNALAAWGDGNNAALNFYDANKGAWSGAVQPDFGSPSDSSVSGVHAKLHGSHAIVAFPGLGVAETSDGKTWTETPTSGFLGFSPYIGNPSVAMSGDYTSAIVWTDPHQEDPSSLWSAIRTTGGSWQAPTAPFVNPELASFWLHDLPDNSIQVVYDHRLDQVTPGNIAARRYIRGKGWSSEQQIGAGGGPSVAYDSFGNALVIGNNATPIARYDVTTDAWTAMPALAKVNDDMAATVALAADGTGYAVYSGVDYVTTDAGLVFDTHIGLQRLIGTKWSSEEIILPTTTDSITLAGATVDDCGDLEVIWTNGSGMGKVVYARRYTPNSGWLPTVKLTKTSDDGYPRDFVGNAHGEIAVPYTTGDDSSALMPKLLRFQ